MSDGIHGSLPAARAAVAAALHWPDNLGIELRPIRFPAPGAPELLAVFVHGLAQEEQVRQWALEPLARLAAGHRRGGPWTPEMLAGLLPAPRVRRVDSLGAAVRGVLAGGTALFVDGAAAAVLLEPAAPAARLAGAPTGPHPERFTPSLLDNVALLRMRLRDPALVARPPDRSRDGAGGAAVVYLEGRADPRVVRQVSAWAQRRNGEAAWRRGLAAGVSGMVGLLPHFGSTPWPDKAAALLDAGHVAVLADRIPLAYTAPVTAPALLFMPGDDLLRRPVAVAQRLWRVFLAGVAVLAPALVVALKEFHQEMIASPFLLALASARENAGYPVFAEVLLMELLQEAVWQTTGRLPAGVTPGQALLASVLFAVVLLLSGLSQTLAVFTGVAVTLASVALPSYDLQYLVRAWRWPMIIAAGMFGLLGMSALACIFLTYLVQARSFGVPFLGETGLRFTSPGRAAGRRTGGTSRAS